eukprot:TRINITY_DN4548_c0_g3_i1.p1 TRINITY_DN4548_c0_g3~~TRINITY_DN4548_c0_g3_i1.p1  ORF type:complete len:232 (+),score=36.75 TRINITY_DN4548_c0_g3_i1:98-793(+)
MADHTDSTEPTEAPAPVRIVKLTGSRLYVGNLSYATNRESLRQHMETAGKVVRAEVLYRYDGKSKGCAIVEYETHEEAVNAVKTLNDTQLDGRPIFIREDREEGGSASTAPSASFNRGPRPARPARPARSAPAFDRPAFERPATERPAFERQSSVRVYVGNVAPGTRWGELKDLFRGHAEVTHADVIYNQHRGTAYGLVSLSNPQEAEKAIASLNGSLFKGAELIVRYERR